MPADSPAQDAADIANSARLSSFIAQLGPTLMSVTHLDVDLPNKSGPDSSETEDISSPTVSLLSLASTCPNLVQLSVAGRVGPSIFQAFGSLCPNLSCLYARLTNLTASTIQQLPALLPNLNSLGVLSEFSVEDNDRGWQVDEDAKEADRKSSNARACIALRACHNLTSFDTTSYDMTAEVWANLPVGLRSCTTSGVRYYPSNLPPAPNWKKHTSLNSLKVSGYFLTVQDLAQVLSAAPQLSTIIFQTRRQCALMLSIGTGLADAMTIVNARLEAGLQTISLQKGLTETSNPTQMVLHMWLEASNHVSSLISASMPVFPSFTSLIITNYPGDAVCDVSLISRMLPNLQDVVFESVNLDDHKLIDLAACVALRSVKMTSCKGVTFEGVAALCGGSHTLRQVKCRWCMDLSASDARLMQRKNWGGKAKVSVVRTCVVRRGVRYYT